MSREVHVRFCESLGVQFPGATQPFRPRSSKSRKGRYFINLSPAISEKASKAIRKEIRTWKLPMRSDKSLEDLSRMFNPILRGWIQYYGRFYRSGLYPLRRYLNCVLARWATRKYKKLRHRFRRAAQWLLRISRRAPRLFAHWQLGAPCGSAVRAV
jgi:RNA-directed DNA polymerase